MEPLGRTVRKRIKAVRYCRHWRQRLAEQEAALRAAQKHALAEFVVFYNHFRLHSSLGYLTPVSRFLGVDTISHHGLAGIPGLPKDLSDTFQPSRPVHINTANLCSLKQRFALVTTAC